MIYKIRRVRHFCLTFIMNRQKYHEQAKMPVLPQKNYKSLRSLAYREENGNSAGLIFSWGTIA